MLPCTGGLSYGNAEFKRSGDHKRAAGRCWYDKIITGDLGKIGKQALADLLRNEGLEAEGFLMDCGVEIYDNQKQDTHAGGSGCGCSALVLGALILPNIQAGIWKRVLFVPTGALLSTVSFNEGQTIPGIAHG